MRMPKEQELLGCTCHWEAEGSLSENKMHYTRTHFNEDCPVHGLNGDNSKDFTVVLDLPDEWTRDTIRNFSIAGKDWEA